MTSVTLHPLAAELVADDLATDIRAGNQHVETCEIAGFREGARDGVRAVFGRHQVDFQPVLRQALGGCRPYGAQLGPAKRPHVERRGQQPLHEGVDRVRAREHDPVEAAGLGARRIERAVVVWRE